MADYGTLTVNNAGTWKRPRKVFAKNPANSAWTLCKKVFINNNGVWEQVWAPYANDLTTTSPQRTTLATSLTSGATLPTRTANTISLSKPSSRLPSGAGASAWAVNNNGFTNGNIYFEMSWTATQTGGAAVSCAIGLAGENFNANSAAQGLAPGDAVGIWSLTGMAYAASSSVQFGTTTVAGGATAAGSWPATSGTVFGCAFNSTYRLARFYRNGAVMSFNGVTDISVPFSGPVFPFIMSAWNAPNWSAPTTLATAPLTTATSTVTLPASLSYPGSPPDSSYFPLVYTA